MSAREMYAPYYSEGGSFGVYTHPQAWPGREDVRVLVQEIPSGMPDFKPGDKVGWSQCYKARVIGLPIRDHAGVWRVPVHPSHCEPMLMRVGQLTKIVPETSRLIRVTGPEDKLRCTVLRMTGGNDEIDGCRVEVVDDPTDGGDR